MPTRPPFDHDTYRNAATPFAKNRLLGEWLSDDGDRAALYDALRQRGTGMLAFPSRAHAQDDPAPPHGTPPKTGHAEAFLLMRGDWIEHALSTPDDFGNRPYAELGTGSFMLALDPGGTPDLHQAQRQAAIGALPGRRQEGLIRQLAEVACQEAAVVSLRHHAFDLADYAEQAALRFSSLLFGFAAQDYGLLEDAMRKAYRALNYQILGRHFVSEPGTVPAANQAMGAVLTRAAAVIDEYQRLIDFPPEPPSRFDHRPDRRYWPEGVEPLAEFGLGALTPVMQKLARSPGQLSGQEMAVIVVGAIAGIVGNVQASACIAVDQFFNEPAGLQPASSAGCLLRVAQEAAANGTPGRSGALDGLIAEALRLDPPVAFIPRRTRRAIRHAGLALPAGADCLLALGAAMRAEQARFCLTPWQGSTDLSFGLGPHSCLGDYLARPLVTQIVRSVLRLPGLAQRLDPATGELLRLEKRWGFGCERYPLLHRRDRRMAQQPLNVIMKIRAPVPENALKLRRVIRYGAPRIERALREARHVHFAWFELLENDSKLALHTVFDGDFDAYVQHFALKVDELFDQLFACIEDAPPLPVGKHPDAFVETIRRFNAAPVEGYFFSAYPTTEVPDITRNACREAR